ncbi:MAG: class I SAM-dependent methyltransferase [Rhodospirillales bacterium]
MNTVRPDDYRPDDYRIIWSQKPVLREIYTDYYRRIAKACVPGPVLEIGGGSGNFKAFMDEVVSTDITPSPWLDAACDAHRLPFKDGAFANIIMIDVLHHMERPAAFFAEARRTLKPGGRIVMIEPAITPVSYPFYAWLHPEPVDMKQDLTREPASAPGRARDPFDANQAVPTLIFHESAGAVLAHTAPGFRLVDRRRLSFWAYPLSGGFRPWSLLGARPARWLLKTERALEPLLGRLAAFRLMAVLERTTPGAR